MKGSPGFLAGGDQVAAYSFVGSVFQQQQQVGGAGIAACLHCRIIQQGCGQAFPV